MLGLNIIMSNINTTINWNQPQKWEIKKNKAQ